MSLGFCWRNVERPCNGSNGEGEAVAVVEDGLVRSSKRMSVVRPLSRRTMYVGSMGLVLAVVEMAGEKKIGTC